MYLMLNTAARQLFDSGVRVTERKSCSCRGSLGKEQAKSQSLTTIGSLIERKEASLRSNIDAYPSVNDAGFPSSFFC